MADKKKPKSQSMWDSWFGGDTFGEVDESIFKPELPETQVEPAAPVPEMEMKPSRPMTPAVPEKPAEPSQKGYEPDEQFFKDIAADEGEVLSVYKDDRGNETIGIGHLVTPEEKASGKIYGINYRDGISKEEAQEIKKRDVYKHLDRAKKLTPNFEELPQNVQNNILNATFHGTWTNSPAARKLFAEGKYAEAADEFLNHKDYQKRKATGTGGTYTKRMERTADAIRSMATTPAQVGEPAPAVAPKPEQTEMPDQQRQKMEEQLDGFKAQYQNQLEDFKTDAADLDSQLVQELASAQNTYKASTDRLASRELWETIINAVGHLAAGLIGNQTGLNLGGIKFDKKDWDAKRSLLLSELKDSKQQAFQKMSAGQRKLAERRSAAYQDYQVEARDIDRALQQLRHQEDLAWKREKAAADRTHQIKQIELSADKEQKRQIKSLLSNARTDMGRALNNLNKKADEENLQAVALEAVRYNKQAEALGLPPLYPEASELTADVPRKFWWNKAADYETVNKRLQEFYSAGDSAGTAPAGGVKYITLSSGKRIPVKDK